MNSEICRIEKKNKNKRRSRYTYAEPKFYICCKTARYEFRSVYILGRGKRIGKPAVHTDIPLKFLYGFKNACSLNTGFLVR